MGDSEQKLITYFRQNKVAQQLAQPPCLVLTLQREVPGRSQGEDRRLIRAF